MTSSTEVDLVSSVNLHVEAASNSIHGDAEKGKGKSKKWKSATNKLKSVSAFKQHQRQAL